MAEKKVLHRWKVETITGGFGNPGAVVVSEVLAYPGEQPEGAQDLGPAEKEDK